MGAAALARPNEAMAAAREGAGDANEARFHWHLVEDKQNFAGGSITYAEYLPIVARESAMGALGGTGGGGGGNS